MKDEINMLTPIKKQFSIVVAITVLILLIPLIAMQLTAEVNWSLSDFIVMGLLCFASGSAFVLASRVAAPMRLVARIAIVVVFFYIWAELSVGIFTSLGS